MPIGSINVVATGLQTSVGEEIFLYELDLPQDLWFEQIEGETYWFDVAARSADPEDPYIWRWQRAAGTASTLCPPAWKEPPNTTSWQTETIANMAFRITSNDLAEEGLNKVVADDFVSDGRPIRAVRWWGSYLDPKYAPDYPPAAPYLVDGWIISFHHDNVMNPGCPPD
ncbi:MAG: hypothetical protein GY778_31255, partial [bacterium]|nr:hypothetical protein [bacterium]